VITITEVPSSNEVGQAEKVHILESFDDSDPDSETLSERLRSIDAYNEVGQGSEPVGGE
jgi:hypothetical protein